MCLGCLRACAMINNATNPRVFVESMSTQAACPSPEATSPSAAMHVAHHSHPSLGVTSDNVRTSSFFRRYTTGTLLFASIQASEPNVCAAAPCGSGGIPVLAAIGEVFIELGEERVGESRSPPATSSGRAAPARTRADAAFSRPSASACSAAVTSGLFEITGLPIP